MYTFCDSLVTHHHDDLVEQLYGLQVLNNVAGLGTDQDQIQVVDWGKQKTVFLCRTIGYVTLHVCMLLIWLDHFGEAVEQLLEGSLWNLFELPSNDDLAYFVADTCRNYDHGNILSKFLYTMTQMTAMRRGDLIFKSNGLRIFWIFLGFGLRPKSNGLFMLIKFFERGWELRVGVAMNVNPKLSALDLLLLDHKLLFLHVFSKKS